MSKIFRYLFLLFFTSFSSTALFADIQLKQNWTFPLAPNGGGTPVLYPDEVQPTHIVVAGADGKLYRLDASGQAVFVYELGERTGCDPAVGDLDGDGSAEIVLASVNGVIHCVDEDGKARWLFSTGSRIGYTITLADVDRDGRLEVLASTRSGWLYCLNAEGTVFWKFKSEPQAGPPVVGDVNGDGWPEVVYGTDLEKIYCLTHDGKYLWHRELDGRFGRSLPILVDIDDDGSTEILITRSEVCPNAAVIALAGADGRVLWQAPTTLHGYGPLAVADIDRDGEKEILAVDKSTSVYCIDAQGRRKWSHTFTGHGIFYPPGIADLNGDGRMDLVVSLRRGDEMFVLDATGNLQARFPLPGGGNTSPTIADLDGDGRVEIYMLTQQPGGLIQFVSQSVVKKKDILWATWRGNSRRNGVVLSAAADVVRKKSEEKMPCIDRGDRQALLGGNSIIVDFTGKEDESLLIQTRLIRRNGPISSTLEFVPHESSSLSADFFIEDVGQHRLEVKVLKRRTGTLLKKFCWTVSADGFSADKKFFKTRIAALDSVANLIPSRNLSDLDFVSLQKLFVENQLRKLQVAANAFRDWPEAKRAAFVGKVQNNRNQVEHILSVARFLLAQRMAGNRAPFVCWQDPNPWDDVPPEQVFPVDSAAEDTLVVVALGNETESRALYLTNLGAEALYLKIRPVQWVDAAGEPVAGKNIVEFREGIPVGTVKQKIVVDALPALNEGRVIVLPVLESRQLWLTLRTGDLPPGRYRGTLSLYALGLENPEQKMVIDLYVSEVRLPEKSRFSFYTWAHIGADPNDEMSRKRFRDLLDHLTTVFSVSAPRQQFDANGNLVGDVDWSRHDAWMEKFRGKGIVLIPSFQYSIKGPKEVPMWSEPWKKAYIAALRRYVAHLKEMGFDYSDFALYPVDEPWLTGMENVTVLLNCARLAKEADPNVQIYCDPAGMPTPENSAEVAPYIDIWMPQIDLLKRKDKSLLNFYKSTGKTVWAYEAPGVSKLLKPLGLYRMQPWLAFRYGLTGSGMWTYNYKNIWLTQQPPPFNISYCIVYEDGQTLVPSRRWQAYRDGVEDYNMLTLLQEKIENARRNKANSKLISKAETLLQNAVMDVTQKQEEAESINRLIIDYDPDYLQLQTYREQIIRMLEELD